MTPQYDHLCPECGIPLPPAVVECPHHAFWAQWVGWSDVNRAMCAGVHRSLWPSMTALALAALFLSGCSAYTWACGPTWPPWTDARQWPESYCQAGPR